MTILAASLALVLLFLVLRYSFFLPEPAGIRVLMYHDLSTVHRDFLTVHPDDFRRQLAWLRDRGFRAVSLQDALDHLEGKLPRDRLPKKPVLITFDDGYRSNVSLALPILKEFDFPATIFVTSAYIQEREERGELKYLSVRELQKWTDSGMELALHSHEHLSYKQLDAKQVVNDLEREERLLQKWGLGYRRALAYPFGARPKARAARDELKSALSRFGIRAAFRIGNRVQPFYREGTDLFELKRIDIRGDESFFEFKMRVRKGRTKQF